MKYFSAIALFLGTVAIVSLSSFIAGDPDKSSGYTFFKFDESASPIENELVLEKNWMVVSDPGGTPLCPTGYSAPCVIRVDNATVGIDETDSHEIRVQKLTYYMSTLTGITAEDFVSDPAIYVFQRP